MLAAILHNSEAMKMGKKIHNEWLKLDKLLQKPLVFIANV